MNWKNILAYILSFTVILGILIMVVNFIVMPMYTRVGAEFELPDVTLMTRDSARMVLEKMDLIYVEDDSVYDNNVEQGRIVSQKPAPFTRVKKNRRVYLTLSRGPKINTVPDFRGVSLRDVRYRLSNLGLKEGWVRYEQNDEYPEGVIFEQSPPPGSKIVYGQKINFYVSLGGSRENIRLPQLVGMSLVAAERVLHELKIMNIRIVYEKREDLLPGTVIDQFPSKGTPLLEVSEVKLVISN